MAALWWWFGGGLAVLMGLMWVARRAYGYTGEEPELAHVGGERQIVPLDQQISTTTRTAGAPPPPMPPLTAPPAPAPTALMPFAAVWEVLLGAVHVLIVGETNAGKSTAAKALLAGRSDTDMICVIDPHAEPGDWGGIAAVGAGRNYVAIDAALGQLLDEMASRYLRRAAGDKSYAPLTIFVDEMPAIMSHCKAAKPFFGELVREARKVNMRLVVLTQSTRVKTLGIEGEGDVLENLTWLHLGEKALAVCPDAALLDWPAALEKGGKIRAAYTTAFPGIAERRVLPSRIWELSTVSPLPLVTPAPPPVVLEPPVLSMVEVELAGFEREMPTKPAIPPVNTTPESDANTTPKLTKGREKAIRQAADKGLSRNAMAGLIGGDKGRTLELIAQVLGPTTDEDEPAIEQPTPEMVDAA